MKIIAYFTFLCLGLSCATDNKTPHHKQLRVGIEQSDYKRVDFYLSSQGYDFFSKRAPASFVKKQKKKSPQQRYSNRQIYFLSFYKQHKALQSILNVKEENFSCPSFHQVIVDNKELTSKHLGELFFNTDFTVVADRSQLLSSYPLLALPYSNSEDLYTVLKRNHWKNPKEFLKSSLVRLYHTQKDELAALCDKGVSPGHYIYENIVTQFKQRKEFHRNLKGLRALLKVPVLANVIILDALAKKNNLIPYMNPYEQELLERADTLWFTEYAQELKRERSRKKLSQSSQVSAGALAL